MRPSQATDHRSPVSLHLMQVARRPIAYHGPARRASHLDNATVGHDEAAEARLPARWAPDSGALRDPGIRQQAIRDGVLTQLGFERAAKGVFAPIEAHGNG